jgi:hypothetical protein
MNGLLYLFLTLKVFSSDSDIEPNGPDKYQLRYKTEAL